MKQVLTRRSKPLKRRKDKTLIPYSTPFTQAMEVFIEDLIGVLADEEIKGRFEIRAKQEVGIFPAKKTKARQNSSKYKSGVKTK
jgi:hypothetical protein